MAGPVPAIEMEGPISRNLCDFGHYSNLICVYLCPSVVP